MIYLILVCIILYLLYREYKFSKQVAVLISSYLFLLKISYLNDKKNTIKNLNIFLSLLNNTISVDEWNTGLTILAKAWNTVAPKKNNVVSGTETVKNIVDKLDYSIKDPDFKKLVDEARLNLDELNEDESL